MNNFRTQIATMSIMLSSSFIYAYTASPSLNNKCTYSLNTPANGVGVTFDESCSVAYVHPPKFGDAELNALAPSSNLQFCSAIDSVGASAKTTVDSMNTLANKVSIENFGKLNTYRKRMQKKLPNMNTNSYLHGSQSIKIAI